MRYNIYLAAFVIFVASSCTSEKATERQLPAVEESTVALTAAQAKNINLQTGKAEFGQINKSLKLQGNIEVPPQNLVSVSMPLGGYLKSTKMLPGTRVRKGDIIAVLEDPLYIELQQDYLSVANRLSYAVKELSRQKELNLSKANSDKTLQMAETDYQNLRVEHMALLEKLKLINIDAVQLSAGKITKSINLYSPISGYVSKVNVNIGRYVTPSDVIMELINPSDIHLKLTIYEKDVPHVVIGQSVLAYSNAAPQEKYETKVILVSRNLEGGRSEIHCHFDKYDKRLVPGMYMNAELKVNSQTAQFLPEDAVVGFEGKDYVFVQDSSLRFQMLEVSTGENSDGRISVRTDLGGKQVVLKGAYSLLMKLKNTDEEV